MSSSWSEGEEASKPAADTTAQPKNKKITADERRRRRLEFNRLAAKASRRRKREKMQALEQRVKELEDRSRELEIENKTLKQSMSARFAPPDAGSLQQCVMYLKSMSEHFPQATLDSLLGSQGLLAPAQAMPATAAPSMGFAPAYGPHGASLAHLAAPPAMAGVSAAPAAVPVSAPAAMYAPGPYGTPGDAHRQAALEHVPTTTGKRARLAAASAAPAQSGHPAAPYGAHGMAPAVTAAPMPAFHLAGSAFSQGPMQHPMQGTMMPPPGAAYPTMAPAGGPHVPGAGGGYLAPTTAR